MISFFFFFFCLSFCGGPEFGPLRESEQVAQQPLSCFFPLSFFLSFFKCVWRESGYAAACLFCFCSSRSSVLSQKAAPQVITFLKSWSIWHLKKQQRAFFFSCGCSLVGGSLSKLSRLGKEFKIFDFCIKKCHCTLLSCSKRFLGAWSDNVVTVSVVCIPLQLTAFLWCGFTLLACQPGYICG